MILIAFSWDGFMSYGVGFEFSPIGRLQQHWHFLPRCSSQTRSEQSQEH